MMALARVVVVVVMCGAAAALEGLVPPDAAELLAEALGAASAPPGLSAAETRSHFGSWRIHNRNSCLKKSWLFLLFLQGIPNI